MNSQRAPLPVRKRSLRGERPARRKSFFSFKTPDSKASAKSPNEFCVLRALIQRREERTERRYPLPRERISGSGGRWGRMLKDARRKKWRFDPLWTESRNLRKMQRRRGRNHQRRSSVVMTTTGRDKRNCAFMKRRGRGMESFVQIRRDRKAEH